LFANDACSPTHAIGHFGDDLLATVLSYVIYRHT